MVDPSDEVKTRVNSYLAEVQAEMRKLGSVSSEVVADLRAHIHNELESGSADLETVLARLGTPSELAKSSAGPRKKRRWLWAVPLAIGSLLLILTLLVVIGPLSIWVDRLLFPNRRPPDMPPIPDMPDSTPAENYVITGAGWLERETLFQPRSSWGYDLYDVSDLRVGNLRQAGIEIGIPGISEAYFVDPAGEVRSSVHFAQSRASLAFVDVDGDGNTEFFDRGGLSNEATLMDRAGRVLWASHNDVEGPEGRVQTSAFGDVDGDGKPEFAVGYTRLLQLYDLAGRKRWEIPVEWLWAVQVVDVDGDGRCEIVCFAGQQLIVLRGDGSQQRAVPGFWGPFSIAPSPDAKRTPLIFRANRGVAFLIDFEGNQAARFNLPDVGQKDFFSGHAVVANLGAGQRDRFAMVANWSNGGLFAVLTSQGEQLYAEVLPESTEAIATIQDPATGFERILVGGRHTVWQYRLRASRQKTKGAAE